MNNKGFTLVELLTVLVVMSFVMVMIAPSIMDLLDSNNNKKYVNYENVITELAIASDYKDSEFIRVSTAPFNQKDRVYQLPGMIFLTVSE